MPRHGFVVTLLAAVALVAAGCGPAQVAQDTAQEAAVEVAAAMGVEGQALAALGVDPVDLDPAEPAPADGTPTSADGTPAPAGAEPRRGERAEEWRKRRAARVLLRRNALHGEVVVQTRDGGTRTVAVQRGEVTAVDGDSVTVKSADGFTMTWTFGDGLRVVERRSTIQPKDVAVGTTVGVAGAKEGDTGVARLIVVPRRQD
ncbi:hypothetical protein GA0070616_2466 [Micromonospora nigra]|uniref:DUF5666 domain-containing protein n=1 Tax=Micromonospora nigra TaxID=145857 RepID=A0A1C6RYD9_9ACTN|nr:hypothetical protein [Micromonospora nigra]SCL22094.1 hypothetical protein GA0070616_2466 [Micromonospora nigra]